MSQQRLTVVAQEETPRSGGAMPRGGTDRKAQRVRTRVRVRRLVILERHMTNGLIRFDAFH